MKKINFKKEISLVLISSIPLIYLFIVWAQLPIEVATHYNIDGEADRFSSKSLFALILAAMLVFNYLLMLALPFIDPKGQIKEMGNKFYQIKYIIIGFVSVIACFMIYKTIYSKTPIYFIVVILGVLFIALGNYFQTIKPNYFLGIRTPWTLQNDNIWTRTHRFSGKIYMICGFIMIGCYFLFANKVSSFIMLGLIIPLAIFPYLYSFLLFKKNR